MERCFSLVFKDRDLKCFQFDVRYMFSEAQNLGRTVATSIQEVSWLSAVSEKSFCSFILNFSVVAVLVFKIHFQSRKKDTMCQT